MDTKNGVVETHYGNGQLESRANYKDGKLNGLREEWYDNGQLESRETYKDGKLDGLREVWHANGQLWAIETYNDGKLNGLYEAWYDNGQQWTREHYKDGKRGGLFEYWYSSGQLRSRSNYKDDNLDGLRETWRINGELSSSAIYKNGKVVEYIPNKHEQNMVEQESIRNVSEEKLLRLCKENLAMGIMLLRDKQVAGEITFKESLKQSVGLIEEYDKNKIEEYAQQQVKSCAIPLVSNSLDLRELERKLDEALGKETRETLTEWLKQQRQ